MVSSKPFFAEDDVVDLVVVADAQDDDVACLADVRRRRRD
jgi:hypothetical protein